MLKTIIIDDEEHARHLLFNSIKHSNSPVEVLASCADVESAVLEIKKHKPDFVFLDIEMPNYSGFELLDFFEKIEFEIVFVTAYSQYAVQAFEVSAVDYLLKPLQIDRLEAAIKRVQDKLKLRNSSSRIKTLKENIQSSKLKTIVLPYANVHKFVQIDDIIALEASRAYCNIHLLDGRKLLVSKSLSHFENILSEHSYFVRIHRSFLVNVQHVKKYTKRTMELELANNLIVKISRERKEKFEIHFNKTNKDL